MPERHTKHEAEAILRELPSVLGAHVREDVNGHPREVHLLVRPGTTPRELARDVRDLLEERLGVPVDQRVISIAQLADPDEQPKPPRRAAKPPPVVEGERLEFMRLESEIAGGRLTIRVVLYRQHDEIVGEAREVDAPGAAARAAARATAAAVSAACGSFLRLDVDVVAVVEAMGRDHVLVDALAASRLFGRAPRRLVASHPAGEDVREAAVLAVLKGCNRAVALALGQAAVADQDQPSSSSNARRDTYSRVLES